MQKLVPYPPKNVGEYSTVSVSVLGMIPCRVVVSKRIDGWCAYLLLKYMRVDYYLTYGDPIGGPTTWERVRDNGDKVPEQYARQMLPEMEGPYAR